MKLIDQLIFPIFILLLVAGCANVGPYTAQVSKATESEIKNALNTNYRCLLKYIDMLDDNLSGADVIARAVVNSCESEATFAVNELIRGVYPVNEQEVFNSMKEKNYSLSLTEILRRRSAQKIPIKCEQKCEVMFKNGDLKEGVTLQKCIELLCY